MSKKGMAVWENKRRKEFWEGRRNDFVDKLFPPRIRKILNTKDIKPDTQDVKALVEEGSSIFLYGDVGTGKTVYGATLLIEAIKYGFIEQILPLTPNKVEYARVVEILCDLRATFSQDSEWTEKGIINHFSSVPLLMLDDIGEEKSTDWTIQSLRIIINSRYDNLLPTIITSNWDLDQLAEMDDRIASRIYEMCNLKPFNGKNYRLEK